MVGGGLGRGAANDSQERQREETETKGRTNGQASACLVRQDTLIHEQKKVSV